MSQSYDPQSRQSAVQRRGAGVAADIDEGLRSYMLKVYNYMGAGLALTGVIAYFTANTPALLDIIFTSPMMYIVMFSPLVVVMIMSFGANKISSGTAQILYWVFASLMGLSLSSILLMYTGESIARVFFITAGMFGAMSLWGYTTKKDLTGMGSFLIMGLFGIIIAMVVNIFLQSAAMQFAISVLGVLIFTGLTAWDTQKIKKAYDEGDGQDILTKKAVFGALRLYLDFINMFLFMLRLFGARR